jgi:hypothetical protein
VTVPSAWWVEYAAPKCIGQFLDPLAPFGVSSVVWSLLESVEYHPICTLDLSVGPWMGNGDIPDVDPTVLAVLPELVVVEIGTQVCDNVMG